MGIFNNRGLAQSLVAKMQEKKAAQAAVKSNPNATTRDYLQAGMSPGSILAAKARARQATTPLPGTGFGTAIDRLRASSTRNQMQPTAPGQPSGIINPSDIIGNPMRFIANNNINNNQQMNQTRINPKAFTNQGAISGMFGAANEGTFTRTVGDTPLAQMTSQGYMPPMDPTNPTEQNDVNAVMAETGDMGQGYSDPVAPPYGVDTPITPNYDLNAQ
jgi:hypothetical protein